MPTHPQTPAHENAPDDALRDEVRRRLRATGAAERLQTADLLRLEEEMTSLLADYVADAGFVPREQGETARWIDGQIPDWQAFTDEVSAPFDTPRGAATLGAAPRSTGPAPLVERLFGTLRRDVAFAVRSLRKAPGFAVAAILVLGLGIGFNVSIFTVLDSLIFEPLPVADADRLVSIYGHFEDGPLAYEPLSPPDVRDLAAASRTLSGVAAFATTNLSTEIDGRVHAGIGELVTGDYFRVLGAGTAVGRAIEASDEAAGGDPMVAVLAHRMWVSEFGADPDVVGRQVRLNGKPFTIVGVAAPEFRGLVKFLSPDLWVPLESAPILRTGGMVSSGDRNQSVPLLDDRPRRWLWTFGRLADGADFEAAAAEMEVLAAAQSQAHPEVSPPELRLMPTRAVVFMPDFDGHLVGASSGVLLLVGLVLVIACANLANVLLARGLARRKEIATRLSLGAGRLALVRQLLTESLVLAAAGGFVGLLIAFAASRGLPSLPLGLPIPIGFDAARIDVRVFLFTLLLTSLAAIAFGLLPALSAARTDVATVLREESVRSDSRGRRWLIRALVLSQLASSVVLLLVAGLAVRGLVRAQQVDPGFRVDDTAFATFWATTQGWEPERAYAFYDALAERLDSMPDVVAVGRAGHMPLTLEVNFESLRPEGGENLPDAQVPSVQTSSVDAGYFAAMDIPLRSGRMFADTDGEDAPKVALVNEAFVRRYVANTDGADTDGADTDGANTDGANTDGADTGGEPRGALGRRFQLGDGVSTEWVRVIGVVADSKYVSLSEEPVPYLYQSLEQEPDSSQSIVARTAGGGAQAAARLLRRTALEIEPGVVFQQVSTQEALVSRSLGPARVASGLLGALGLLGLVLSSVGLYGVVSYAVGRRTHEIGIRMALGADRGKVLASILRDGLGLTAVGVGLGLAAAWLGSGVLASVLTGVDPTDPLTWALVITFLFAVAGVATFLPARRAASLDPSMALRHD